MGDLSGPVRDYFRALSFFSGILLLGLLALTFIIGVMVGRV